MKNWIFPRAEIQNPSRELVEAYSKIFQKKNVYIMLPYTAAVSLMVMAVAFFAFSGAVYRALFILPQLLLLASNILILNRERFFWLGPVLFILSLGNFGMLAGVLLLSYPMQDPVLCLLAYYVLLLVFFGGIVFCYRKNYQNFKEIAMLRAAGLGRPRKPYGIISSCVTAACAMLIAKTIPFSIIGMAVLGLLNYYLCPVIAEQIILVRQYNHLPQNPADLLH